MPDPIEKFFLPGGLFFYFYFEKPYTFLFSWPTYEGLYFIGGQNG